MSDIHNHYHISPWPSDPRGDWSRGCTLSVAAIAFAAVLIVQAIY